MTTIETERLILRPPVLSDFEELARVGSDPEVMRYISTDGQPLPRFNSWQSFASISGHWGRGLPDGVRILNCEWRIGN